MEQKGSHRVLPDGCVDILFSKQFDRPVSLDAVGLMTAPKIFDVPAGRSFFGVRFRPGMAESFIPGAALLKDAVLPLDSVLGATARRLLEQLTELSSPERMAGVMEGLLRPLEPSDPGHRLLRQLAATELPLSRFVSGSGLSL